MVDAGVEIGSHDSDMYVPVNDVTTALIKDYTFNCNVTTFYSNITGERCYDTPFAFNPYWEARTK